ncbi:uncharacterized protein LOC117176623 [Belonocnema kinseyi]|uniref:uncharacterized protein LOC117176623 n=1 Tax=Belonocnema kinseyi TaxID=2817044 RepID=UPI00143CE84D|nr:uncharacterized protein LOC117176623 [Belonocnema kinseyi]
MVLRVKLFKRESHKIKNTIYLGGFDFNRSSSPFSFRKTEELSFLVHPSGGSFIDDSSSLKTGTSITFQESLESGKIKFDDQRVFFEGRKLRSYNAGTRIYRYRKKKTFLNGNFSAPAGVNPYHVASSSARKYAGPPRLIFIWPQKTPTHGTLFRIVGPLMHGILTGLILLDIIHIWPGEFLPKSLPSSVPPPKPPIKCNVIEPRWFDRD